MNQRLCVGGSIEYVMEMDTEQNVARLVRRKGVETKEERGVREAKAAEAAAKVKKEADAAAEKLLAAQVSAAKSQPSELAAAHPPSRPGAASVERHSTPTRESYEPYKDPSRRK